VYARVSSADPKPDLDRQVAGVTVWATGQKIGVDGLVIEVVDAADADDDLVRGVTERLGSLRARLHGRRGAANRVRRAVEAASGEPA
jgi:predicted site-specific integrase-resolvase